MADNVTTQSGTPATLPSGFQIATDDVAGTHFQKLKIDVGGDGVSLPLSNANPIPVSIQNSSLEISNDVGNPVPVSGPLTDAQLRAAAVPTIGPLTDAQLRAAAVPVNISGVTVGEKPAASSLPVVLATENSTDMIVNGPAAQSALNALPIPSTDTTKYRFVSVQVNSTATAGSYIFEMSNDAGANWVPVALQDVNLPGSGNSIYVVTASNRMFHGAISGALFRVRVSVTLTGGSIQAFAVFSQAGTSPGMQMVTTPSTGFAVVGNANHGGGFTNQAFQMGVESRTTARAATGDAQTTRLMADKLGRLIMIDGQIRELVDNNNTTLTTTTETTLIAAVASVNHDVREFIVTNTSATDVRIDFRDSVAGTVRLSVLVKALSTLPISCKRLKQATANTSWTVQLSAAVTDVRITSISERAS